MVGCERGRMYSRERRRREGESHKQMVLQGSVTGFPCSIWEEAGEEQAGVGALCLVGTDEPAGSALAEYRCAKDRLEVCCSFFFAGNWQAIAASAAAAGGGRSECTGGGGAHARRAVVAEIELWHGVAVESFAAVGPRRVQRVHWDALRRLTRTRRIPAHRAMPGTAALLARVVFGLVCVLGDASTHEPSVSVTSSLEDVFGGLVSQGGGRGRNVIEVIEQDEGNELQLASLFGRIGGAASEGPLRKPGGGLNSLLERLVMMSRRRPPPRRHTPKTFVGGVLLPLLAACVITYFIAKRFFSDAAAELLRRAFGSKPAVHAFAFAEAAREAAVRRGVTLQGVTRVFVSLYFVHEGSAAFQVKFEQLGLGWCGP